MSTPSIGKLELDVLLTAARLGAEAFGLAIRADLTARTGRNHSVGAIYTTLQRLEDKGFLTSHTSAPLPVRGGRSRRLFSVTSAGTQALRDAQQHAMSVWAGIRLRGPSPA